MGVDHCLTFGPFKDREASILRRDECNGVALILDELRRRQVPRAAELIRMDDGGFRTHDRFRHRYLLDPWPATAASDLGAKTKHLMLFGENHGAIDPGQAGNCINRPAERLLPQTPARWIGSLPD